MWKIFKSAQFNILVGILLIISGSLLYSSVYNENLYARILNTALVPVQTYFSNLFRDADGIIPRIRSIQDMEKEICELRLEVRSLRSKMVDYQDLKRQNEQYAKYLDLKKERQDFKFVTAQVIGRDPQELFFGFTINKGTESGIHDGDCVITENGMVGCVYQAQHCASKVKTILCPDIKVGAYDSLSGDSGVICGNIKLSDQGLTALSLIQSQNSIKKGDIIVSSGLSGMYPRNLKIGKVTAMAYDNVNGLNYAEIEPFEDIRNIRDVLVITDFFGKGEIAQEVFKNDMK